MPPEVSAFITLLINASVVACVPVATIAVYRLLSAHAAQVRQNVGEKRWLQFKDAVVTVVQAARQSGLVGWIENTGAVKKQWAIDTLQAIVDSNGWNIPIAQIEAEIESAIAQGLHKAQEAP